LDVTSILLFVVALAATVGLIFGLTAFALWLRTKIVWTPAGKFLVRLGRAEANGTVNDFRAGRRYVVVQGFTDYHGGRFEAGERLTFKSHNFVPYHGGHVLEFEERAVYLQEEENADVLTRIWAYIEPARR
jgi:hypothetical protein